MVETMGTHRFSVSRLARDRETFHVVGRRPDVAAMAYPPIDRWILISHCQMRLSSISLSNNSTSSSSSLDESEPKGKLSIYYNHKMMQSTVSGFLLLLLLVAATTHAFVVLPSRCILSSSSSPVVSARNDSPKYVPRYMTECNSAEAEQEETSAEDHAAVGEQEEPQEEQEEEEPLQEDPELVALKEEIASLESKIKETRRKTMAVSDRADEYSKEGYARKVAEMENMRRARSKLNSSSRESAKANLLAQFLPVLDRLEELKAKYGDDAFGKQYNALPGTMETAMREMGVTEYTVQVGDAVDKYRMMVVESQHSDKAPANTVLEVLKEGGLELEGNVMRMPEVIASLGPGKKQEEKTAEEPSSKQTDSVNED